MIAEGAGFTSELMAEQNVPQVRYICIVPTEDFQRKVFAKRSWIQLFLRGCSDPSMAFENWMRRDLLFAAETLRQAHAFGYNSILVNRERTITDNYNIVKNNFGFN